MKKEKATDGKQGKTERQPSLETLGKRIEKQKEALAKSRARYESDKEGLAALLKQRELLRKSELIEAMTRSSRSYEEILAFLTEKEKEK